MYQPHDHDRDERDALMTRVASGLAAAESARRYELSPRGREHRAALLARIAGDLDAQLWKRIEAASEAGRPGVASVSSPSYDPTMSPLADPIWTDPLSTGVRIDRAGETAAAVALRYGLPLSDVAAPGARPSFAELARVAVRVRPPTRRAPAPRLTYPSTSVRAPRPVTPPREPKVGVGVVVLVIAAIVIAALFLTR